MSSFGQIFRVTTFGESHSAAIGGIVEGFPPGFTLDQSFVQNMLGRRKPGQSNLTTKRNESDVLQILSGLENGKTLGTPIGFVIQNQDVIKKDYAEFSFVPRPGHADFTYLMKYGIKAESGGGRSSARETACRVAAGAMAENYLQTVCGVQILSWVSSIGDIEIPKEYNEYLINCGDKSLDKFLMDLMGSFSLYQSIDQEKNEVLYRNCASRNLFNNKGEKITNFKEEPEAQIIIYENNIYKFSESVNVRCPYEPTAVLMIELICKVKQEKDSIGGTMTCVCKNVPIGLGEPCFDKIEALLAHAMLSIPATKGFEIGSGFSGTKMKGSEHNDVFTKKNQNDEKIMHSSIEQTTNNAGGTLGGISNGENIYFRVAFKPVSTIGKEQKTVDIFGNECILEAPGRHDPCVLPRASPIVEAMSSLVLMDCFCRQNVLEYMKMLSSKI